MTLLNYVPTPPPVITPTPTLPADLQVTGVEADPVILTGLILVTIVIMLVGIVALQLSIRRNRAT